MCWARRISPTTAPTASAPARSCRAWPTATSCCPHTIGNYLATQAGKKVTADAPEFKKAEEDVRDRTQRLLGIRGKRTVDHFHRELGLLMWDKCGMARNEAGLREALQAHPGNCARNSGRMSTCSAKPRS